MTQHIKNSYNKKGNIERQVITIPQSELTDKQVIGRKIDIKTKSTITLPPHHISIVPLTSMNFPNKIQTNTLLEMEESPWNPGGDSIRIKRNTTFSYMKELDHVEKSQSEQQENIKKIAEIIQEQVPPMPEKSAFFFITTFIQNQK